jgi:hypothetical protein
MVSETGYLFTITTYKFEITATVLFTKYFCNVKGTIYGNGLPRVTQVKKKNLGTEFSNRAAEQINKADRISLRCIFFLYVLTFVYCRFKYFVANLMPPKVQKY